MENNNKGVQDNYIFGTYFETVSFFIVSMPKKNHFGVFSQPHLDFLTNAITFYVHSNTLNLVMNAMVHVQAFKSGLVSHVYMYSTLSSGS